MQKVLEGISSLPCLLEDIGCKKLFLVIDSSYPFLSIHSAVESLPAEEKVFFSDFTPNPQYEEVCKGLELLKLSPCDTILAVGGGSAIDVAKCIKLAILAESGSTALIPPLVSQQMHIEQQRFPFIAVPTTAGTGSESTHNAVMYYQGRKQSVTNDGILPDYAILEPAVLKTLPLYQKKSTMMDAFCQGLESWWSINSTDESRTYSEKAVKLIMANWRKYIFENDSDAASQIMLAANYSGRAINIAQTTAAHAMSYKITSMYGLSHGHAVSVCLPVVWEYMVLHMDQILDCRGQEHLERVFSDIASTMGTGTTVSAIALFRQMMSELELEKPNSDNLVSDLEVLTDSVNPERMKNSPVRLSSSIVKNLYSNIVLPARITVG